jgi:hypothetical protein
MTSEGMGEMFEGDFADMSTNKFQLCSMWGQVTLSSLRKWGVRTPSA